MRPRKQSATENICVFNEFFRAEMIEFVYRPVVLLAFRKLTNKTENIKNLLRNIFDTDKHKQYLGPFPRNRISNTI